MAPETTRTYHVHLREAAPAEVEEPIETGHLDFYDSGVWIDRETDRVFFPWAQVAMIREVETLPETDEPDANPEAAAWEDPPERGEMDGRRGE